jgi:manganese/zinc/iron transport system permease protein
MILPEFSAMPLGLFEPLLGLQWHPHLDNWIVLIGAMCAVACALPGCFLLLRGMSMMGDAISHAVLPGLAVAFILAESKAAMPMFLGAAVVGVLTAVFTHWVGSFGRIERGAAMGIVFTTLFALGLILIDHIGHSQKVDLDPNCVLIGSLESTPLDVTWRPELPLMGQIGVPRAALVMGSVLLLNLAVIALLFKEFRISSFDPALATTLGINATLMHYLLMVMVAITTVAAFEAVGSIIVIAMLVVPAAAASLLTRRLVTMLGVAVVVAGLCAVLGHLGAKLVPGWMGFTKNATTSGMMAGSVGGLFVLAWLFAPERGLVSQATRRWLNQRACRSGAGRAPLQEISGQDTSGPIPSPKSSETFSPSA